MKTMRWSGWITALLVTYVLPAGAIETTYVGVAARRLFLGDGFRGRTHLRSAYSSDDPAVGKGDGTDIDAIGISLDWLYDAPSGPVRGRLAVPPGMFSGAFDWERNDLASATFVSPLPPYAALVRRVVVRTGRGIKLIASRNSRPAVDLEAAGAPLGDVHAAFCVTNGDERRCHCTAFTRCAFRKRSDDLAITLGCSRGVPDPTCMAYQPPPTGTRATLRVRASAAVCGDALRGGRAGSIVESLGCGALYHGGGQGARTPVGIPAGGTAIFATNCSDGPCAIGPTARDDVGPASCTEGVIDTGVPCGSGCAAGQICLQGSCVEPRCLATPRTPVSNGAASSCTSRWWRTSAAGSLDATFGAMSVATELLTQVTLTGNAVAPCPRCEAGVCSPAARNAGAPCTALDVDGSTYECEPEGADLLLSDAGLGTLTTDSPLLSDPAGVLCPNQRSPGAFGHPDVDAIEMNGAWPGEPLTPGEHGIVLASLFCVPGFGNLLLDAPADYPGPGALALSGTIELVP